MDSSEKEAEKQATEKLEELNRAPTVTKPGVSERVAAWLGGLDDHAGTVSKCWLAFLIKTGGDPGMVFAMLNVAVEVLAQDVDGRFEASLPPLVEEGVGELVARGKICPVSEGGGKLTTDIQKQIKSWREDAILPASTIERVADLLETGGGVKFASIEATEESPEGSESCSSNERTGGVSPPNPEGSPAAENRPDCPVEAPTAQPAGAQSSEELTLDPNDPGLKDRISKLEAICAKQNEVITKQHRQILKMTTHVKELRHEMGFVKQIQLSIGGSPTPPGGESISPRGGRPVPLSLPGTAGSAGQISPAWSGSSSPLISPRGGHSSTLSLPSPGLNARARPYFPPPEGHPSSPRSSAASSASSE